MILRIILYVPLRTSGIKLNVNSDYAECIFTYIENVENARNVEYHGKLNQSILGGSAGDRTGFLPNQY